MLDLFSKSLTFLGRRSKVREGLCLGERKDRGRLGNDRVEVSNVTYWERRYRDVRNERVDHNEIELRLILYSMIGAGHMRVHE